LLGKHSKGRKSDQKTKILIGCDPDMDHLFKKEENSYYVSPLPYRKALTNLNYFGTDADFLSAIHESRFVVNFGLDNPKLKIELYKAINVGGFNLISPTALINESVDWGEGLISQHNTVIGPHARLGKFVKLNTGVQIHHDAEIGDFCTIAPGAIILGSCAVGPLTFIGAGAILMPHISIGEGVVVGAGAVVTKDIESGKIVKGVPARE